jgi:hypothetical protein
LRAVGGGRHAPDGHIAVIALAQAIAVLSRCIGAFDASGLQMMIL